MTESQRSLSSSRKKRGVVRASTTHIRNKLAKLEGSPGPDSLDFAQRLITRLETLDAEYKGHHYEIVDLLDDEDSLGREQEILDEHDDEMSRLTIRVGKLITTCSSRTDSGRLKIVSKRLNHLEKGISSVHDAIPSTPLDDDKICLLHQYEEKLSEFKGELSDVRSELLSHDLEETSELGELASRIGQRLFDCSLGIKKLLRSRMSAPSTPVSDLKGVKLPKLDVPTYDGNILNWTTFWEQFTVAVHGHSSLSDTEKFAYLRHAVKSGTAKGVIEGLSRSGEQYLEAIESLKSRYNRPRLIHQAHVWKVLEAPSLKDGNGRELRRLHDLTQQHLRALKALGQEPSGPFITSLLELKLDPNTIFEWQRHSQNSHYQQLLHFINLRAQASEASMSDAGKKSLKTDTGYSSKKNFYPAKPITTHAANADASGDCMLCKTERHPLYVCPRFKTLNHDARCPR